MEEKNTANAKPKISFMKNVLILMFSEVAVKVMGLIYKLVITNIEGFGDTGLGYYSSGYQIYSLLLALCSIGIPSVVSKLVSERLAINDNAGAQRIFRITMKLFAGIGLFFSVTLFLFADLIATKILNVPDVSYVLKVLAPAIVFVAASSVFRGYFNAQSNMKPASVSYTLEQFLNCVLSITFVYALIGKDAYIMAAGGNLSTTISVILTFVYIFIYYKRHKIKYAEEELKNSPEYNKTSKQLLKAVLAFSIPITIGSIISVITSVIDTTTVSNCIQIAYSGIINSKEALEQLAMQKAGILSKVDTLVNLPIAINIALSTALLPAISHSVAQKDIDTTNKRLSFSVFISILIIIPCAIGFIVLAEPILKLIYPSASDGAWVLRLASISMIFIALSQTINSGLQGLSKVYIPAIALAVGATIKLILNVILISNPSINIYGAPISSITCQIIAFCISYTSLKKSIKLNMDIKRNVLKPILAGLIMGLVVSLSNYGLNLITGQTISTLISILIGVAVYIISVLLLKILTKEDIFMLPFGAKIYNILEKKKIYM